MTNLFKTAMAATLALGIALPTVTTNAEAGKRERWIAGGIAAGILTTAIIANERKKRRYYKSKRKGSWHRHGGYSHKHRRGHRPHYHDDCYEECDY